MSKAAKSSTKNIGNNDDLLRSQILELHSKSIKKTPSLLTQENINQLKQHLFETFPRRLLKLNKEIAETFNFAHLSKSVSSEGSVTESIPILKSKEDVEKYRSLYGRNYEPYLSYNSTLLLPKGVQSGNSKYMDIIEKHLRELNEFLLNLNECRQTLILLQSPAGKEKSFDVRVMQKLFEIVDDIISEAETAKADTFSGALGQRADDCVLLAIQPQLSDVRHLLQGNEAEVFRKIPVFVQQCRNAYTKLNQFAYKNWNRIETVLKQYKMNYSECNL